MMWFLFIVHRLSHPKEGDYSPGHSGQKIRLCHGQRSAGLDCVHEARFESRALPKYTHCSVSENKVNKNPFLEEYKIHRAEVQRGLEEQAFQVHSPYSISFQRFIKAVETMTIQTRGSGRKENSKRKGSREWNLFSGLACPQFTGQALTSLPQTCSSPGLLPGLLPARTWLPLSSEAAGTCQAAAPHGGVTGE